MTRFPRGDYVIQIGGYRHIDPSKNKKGIGTHFVTGLTTDANEPEYQGKKLELKFMYHPAPKEDGQKQMNAISLQNAIALIEASNVDPGEGKVPGMPHLRTYKSMAES